MNNEGFRIIFENILRGNALGKYIRFSDVFAQITDCLLSSPVNVTAIKNAEDIIALHYADSLFGEAYLIENGACVDVGAGGGFPSLPLAVVRPDIHMTALDSTEKKLRFISDTAEKCGIKNTDVLHARAEEAFARGAELRGRFDCVTARAVAPLNILCELCMPAIRKGGRFIAYRGAEGMSELGEAKRAIEATGGEVSAFFKKDLILSDGKQKRVLVIIEKIRDTDEKYPRKYAKIMKAPL